MNDLISLQLSEVLDLQPFLMAGCVLMHEDRRLYSNSDKETPFMIFDRRTTEALQFPSIIDAWCFFSGRTHKCDQCDGGWIEAGSATLLEAFAERAVARHATMKRQCGICGGFGMLTDQQVKILNQARRQAGHFINGGF